MRRMILLKNSRNDSNYLWQQGRYKAPFLGAHFFAFELIAILIVGGFCVFAYLNGMVNN